MSYLTTADYTGRLPDFIRDDVQAGIPEVRTQAESDAQSLIIDYIGSRYDTAYIFAQTGSNRSDSIIRVMADLSIWYMYLSTSPDVMPDTIQSRYELAIQWLKDVAKQVANPDLPEKSDGTQEEVRYGSVKKRTNHLH